MPRAGSRLAAIGLVAFGLFAAAMAPVAGCESSPCNPDPGENPPVDFRGGTLDAKQMVFETSTPGGSHLNFSSGAQYKIYHQLGGCPKIVQPWVSFSPTGIKNGNEAAPAGNMLEIIDVTSEYVWVRNDGCADFWLRLVAAAPGECDPPGTGSGGDSQSRGTGKTP